MRHSAITASIAAATLSTVALATNVLYAQGTSDAATVAAVPNDITGLLGLGAPVGTVVVLIWLVQSTLKEKERLQSRIETLQNEYQSKIDAKNDKIMELFEKQARVMAESNAAITRFTQAVEALTVQVEKK